MQYKNIKYTFLSLCAVAALASCDNDDYSAPIVVIPTCDDGIMNGDETGVDCGGTTCAPCEVAMELDFTGTYAQVDFIGRPGINTVLSADGETKNSHNVSIPSEMGATFQAAFEARLEAYHDVYATILGADPAAVNFEPNILGDILNGPMDDGFTNNPVTATVLTTVLSNDVLEVAPNFPTTYFNGGSGAPNYEGAVGLTGRTPQDDVIDVSLILLFGGGDGARFSGQDTDDDGMADLPRLTSDGVGLTATISTMFPYLGAPE
ncbi:DUF4331 family protein [Maribacter sp. ACAM166]|uniref:DUF4331 family protein n=1 Tax=Maribacter sp. ACAM166 TaxID=2508996 RepID=UPI0010FDAD19|nr:DUF4331 family protein [Maribacter sp. ACAM166]TLP71247.1 DUF4331 domain-containing protein [Maribacter sp. ACAM166]